MRPRAPCCARGDRRPERNRPTPTLHEAAARVFVHDAAQTRRCRGRPARSRRWPKATRCARCWRRSAACSSPCRSTRSPAPAARRGGDRRGYIFLMRSVSNGCIAVAIGVRWRRAPRGLGARRSPAYVADDRAGGAPRRTRRLRSRTPGPIPAETTRHAAAAALLPASIPSFSVPAALRLADERPVFEMPTSTGTLRRMERVGVLEFTLHGQPRRLAAFVEDGTQAHRLALRALCRS